jgi:hypothetical protein
MKSLIKLILAIIAIIFCNSATDASAQPRETLSARAKNNQSGVTYRQSAQKYRVTDCGKPLKQWSQQVTYRATNDTFVYRSEGKATARHDEISSPVVIFHVSSGELQPGHVYQERGN